MKAADVFTNLQCNVSTDEWRITNEWDTASLFDSDRVLVLSGDDDKFRDLLGVLTKYFELRDSAEGQS